MRSRSQVIGARNWPTPRGGSRFGWLPAVREDERVAARLLCYGLGLLLALGLSLAGLHATAGRPLLGKPSLTPGTPEAIATPNSQRNQLVP